MKNFKIKMGRSEVSTPGFQNKCNITITNIEYMWSNNLFEENLNVS